MQINKNITTVNSNVGSGSDRIKYIVIHYTGNDGDTAWGNTNYFKSANRGASAHYFVDESSIWQCVSDGDIAWHCGTSGSYYHPYCRNTNSIGIEMCSRKSGDTYYFKDQTVSNTIELTKMLMKKYGVPISNVIRHYDVTHKICPAPYVNDAGAWDTFKDKLIKEDNDMTEAQTKAIADASAKAAVEQYRKEVKAAVEELEKKAPSDWAAKYWGEAVAAGVFDGTMPRTPLTREQYATVVMKMKEKPCPSWAKEAVQWAIDRGIIQGDGKEEPTPDIIRALDGVTRAELAVVLRNWAGADMEIGE